MDLSKLMLTVSELAVAYAGKIALALITLIVGLFVVNLIVRAVSRLMDKNKLDDSIKPFLISLVNVLLKVMLLISVASILGIETTSFVAIVGAAGLAVGLALQGSLSNFAGSVLILVFKPFKVGDIIQAQGFVGTVREIQAFNTILLTPDNRVIIVPNGALAGGPIVNLSSENHRRLDFAFKVAPGSDINKVRDILLAIGRNEPKALKNPAVGVVVSTINETSIEVTLNVWVTGAEFVASYWGILFSVNEKAVAAFQKEGIRGPIGNIYVHQP